MPNTKKTTLPTLIDNIQFRATELNLSATTDAQMAVVMNQAVENLYRKHDWVETKTSATIAFTEDAVLPYETFALSAFSASAIGIKCPIYLNNATNDYKFWWLEPDALMDLGRGGVDTHEDVEHAIAIDGVNVLIYHDVAETLTLKYYSKYLVATVTTEAPKEIFDVDGTDADFFIPENEELLILGTLRLLAQKEPSTSDKYAELNKEYEEALAEEKINHPSQRMMRLEVIEFIG